MVPQRRTIASDTGSSRAANRAARLSRVVM
jgi:hypothetical protein